MSQKEDSECVKLTCAYRREASKLAASHRNDCNVAVAASLEQSLGRNALEAANQEPPSINVPSSFLHCHACGSLLQAGKNGTTLRLRSVGRKRTRRRRASRRRAAEFHAKKQMSVGGGRKWRQDSQQEQQQQNEKEERDLLRVTDGACRNAMVVTCGACGYNLKYKGMPSRRQVVMKKQEPKKPPAAASTKGRLGSGDIVSLPKRGGKSSLTRRQRTQGISTAKPQAKRGSGLLDFLSSLND